MVVKIGESRFPGDCRCTWIDPAPKPRRAIPYYRDQLLMLSNLLAGCSADLATCILVHVPKCRHDRLSCNLQKEAAQEAVERERAAAKREALRKQLEAQLEGSLDRKLRGEPAMTKIEREINADLLRRMHAAEADVTAVVIST